MAEKVITSRKIIANRQFAVIKVMVSNIRFSRIAQAPVAEIMLKPSCD